MFVTVLSIFAVLTVFNHIANYPFLKQFVIKEEAPRINITVDNSIDSNSMFVTDDKGLRFRKSDKSFARDEWIDKNGSLPANLHIMFSEWKIRLDNGKIVSVPFPNPHHMPVFTVVFEEEEFPSDFFRCPGNCDVCKENHLGCIAGMNTANGAH